MNYSDQESMEYLTCPECNKNPLGHCPKHPPRNLVIPDVPYVMVQPPHEVHWAAITNLIAKTREVVEEFYRVNEGKHGKSCVRTISGELVKCVCPLSLVEPLKLVYESKVESSFVMAQLDPSVTNNSK